MEQSAVSPKPPNTDKLANDRFVRGSVYAFLGRLFLRELDQDTLKLMNKDDLVTQLTQLGLKVPSHDETGETLECLAADYCSIFLGPRNHVPPLQSVWQSGLLSGPAVDSMRSYLEFVSIERDQDTMIDHFGFQLQVMATILASPVLPDDVGHVATITHHFFQQHLLWARQLLPRAVALAETSFYQSLMEVTDSFLADETERMEALVAQS